MALQSWSSVLAVSSFRRVITAKLVRSVTLRRWSRRSLSSCQAASRSVDTESVGQRPAQPIAHQCNGLALDGVGGDEPAPVRLTNGGDARVLRIATVEQRVPDANVDDDAGHSPGSPYSTRS